MVLVTDSGSNPICSKNLPPDQMPLILTMHSVHAKEKDNKGCIFFLSFIYILWLLMGGGGGGGGSGEKRRGLLTGSGWNGIFFHCPGCNL